MLCSIWQPGKPGKSANTRRTGSIGKWFQTKESSSSTLKKKDKFRLENARVHSALSIAGLATALAAVTAEENSGFQGSKMSAALASATELLASYCIEMAEAAGADHDRVGTIVRSAVDIKSPGDLMTLTAAAATGICCFSQLLIDQSNFYILNPLPFELFYYLSVYSFLCQSYEAIRV